MAETKQEKQEEEKQKTKGQQPPKENNKNTDTLITKNEADELDGLWVDGKTTRMETPPFIKTAKVKPQ